MAETCSTSLVEFVLAGMVKDYDKILAFGNYLSSGG
jgi:hypothetical protein